ncbi:MAG TPA: M1 family aminopeptidase [Burkholderiales bacterium]|nr:M1 family aminopeptidase [Burkholderiales bacterium]
MTHVLRSSAIYVWAALIGLTLPFAARGAQLTLDVQLEPESRRFEAIAELQTDGDLVFALHESLAVRSATVDGQAVNASASGNGRVREWRIRSGRGAAVQIEYGGTLPALDSRIDHRGVLKQLAPMASSAGTFLPASSHWYPQPRGLFTYSVTLSLPASQRGIVPGQLAEERLPDSPESRYVARFDFDAPTEGIDLMAGPYVVREQWLEGGAGKPVRLRTYFFHDLDPLADGYLTDTARYLELYSKQIGAYPFEMFSIVASPLPTGFGMPTLTYIGATVLKLPFIRATSLGHEVLHNWWGNGVYADYARGNWSEGLTTFMADYFYKEQESAAAAREMRQSWLRDFAAVPPDAHRPLTAFRSRSHGAAEAAVGYGKAAMVFFMLRDAIGSERYERGIRSFWDKYRFRTASWADLRTTFEQAAGQPLGAFFEQWIQRAGGPRVNVIEARARRSGGGVALSVGVVQSRPAYTLQLPIEVLYAGKSEMRTVSIHRERQVVTLQLNDVPEGIRVDPELRVWRMLDRAELPPILRQWIVARAPRLVIAAAGRDVWVAAHNVARTFFESAPREVSVATLIESQDPVLIAGLHHEVDALLASHGLPPRPTVFEGRGSAEVWTIEQAGKGAPIAVVSARDAASLGAISRALPHYGAQSYLVFDGSRVITRGVWPAQARVVRVAHEP